MKQTAKVLEYMRTHDGITTLEAFNSLGVTRLSARIWDLKEAGFRIATSWRRVRHRDGTTAQVVLYILQEAKDV